MPVTDRIPLVKSMKASVERAEVVLECPPQLPGGLLARNTDEASAAFTVIQPKHGSSAGESAQKLSDDVERELPDLQFTQNHHRQRHSRVHVAPWERKGKK